LFQDVDVFIESLQKPTRAKWARLLDLLVIYGSSLGMPHARRLPDGMMELRVRGQQEVRAFTVVSGRHMIVLHAFLKKTQKIPPKELRIAKRRIESLT